MERPGVRPTCRNKWRPTWGRCPIPTFTVPCPCTQQVRNAMALPPSRKWLLPFHRAILANLIPGSDDPEQRDRLVVLAPGLGMRRVIATLLRAYYSKQNLVLLVNASSRDITGIEHDLGTLGLPHDAVKNLHHDTASKQRADAYMGGGIISVTSRILIVDMLSKRIPINLITGIVVLHAERCVTGAHPGFPRRRSKRSSCESTASRTRCVKLS